MSELGVLVNTDRVRRSIKRLFTNDIAEVLGELFQNSQRAGATRAEMTTNDTGFVYSDNGHGLLGGLDGLHILLKIAESKFDNETIEAQDPMGLGIHALLGHDQVTSVRFVSGDLALQLDTTRWWNDPAYYQTWFERAEVLEEQVPGLRVEVECDSKLTEKLIDCLTNDYDATHWWGSDKWSPAAGYQKVLAITLNSAHVKSDLPKKAVISDWMFDTEYKGSKVSVGHGAHGFSTVVWYGQLIRVAACGQFQFYMEVYEGRPVNPKSPTRQGLIEDAAYEEFYNFLKDKIVEWVLDPQHRSRIKPRWLASCFSLDALRTKQGPLFLARQRNPVDLGSIGCYQDIDKTGGDEIFDYEHAPLLVDEHVREDDGTEYDYGLSSFLQMIEEDCYGIVSGDRQRLHIKQLWWRPGEMEKDGTELFCQPGEWGLGEDGDEPEEWKLVTASPVFRFESTSSCEIDYTEMLASCADKVEFLQGAAWAAFDNEPDEGDYEKCVDDYTDSLDRLIRKLAGNAVPVHWERYQVEEFFKERAKLAKVEYHYEGSYNPTAITATSISGETVRLKLM